MSASERGEPQCDAVGSRDSASRYACWRTRAAKSSRGLMELLVLVLVCLAPWFYGSAAVQFELLICAGIALLLMLWGASILLEGEFHWTNCSVTVCLAGLVLLAAWQITPLGPGVLARISPGTHALYEQLLPSRPEELPSGERPTTAPHAAGTTISLYPGATRRELQWLLAVFLLFCVVRHSLGSESAMKRLNAALVVTGVLLSLQALMQFFSSPAGTIYGSALELGTPFGPFVCRNHFAFYMNVCLAAGIGMLLGRLSGRGRSRLSDFLQSPQVLWLVGALAVMLAAIVFSASRGGILAALGALIACTMLSLRSSRRMAHWQALVLTAGIAAGLLTWFGIDRIEARLSTVWGGEMFQDARVFLLRESLLVIRTFPVWGTGFGTFRYIEPIYLHTPADVGQAYEHAHNDYLEALLEGGVVGLALVVCATALVFRSGLRASRPARDPSTRGMALGGMFGLVAVGLHSFVEFGLHIPAIAILVTVFCAQVCALGNKEGAERPGRSTGPDASTRIPTGTLPGAAPWQRRLVPGCAAALAMLLAVVLSAEAWRLACGSGWRLMAEQVRAAAGADARHHQIVCLDAAARYVPEDAEVQLDLARAHWALLEDRVRRSEPLESPQVQEHLAAGLRHFMRARDLCPIMPVPHVRLAVSAGNLKTGDSSDAYLRRARLLAPADPRLSYLCGLHEHAEGRTDSAWRSWRRSLELSDDFLPAILDGSSRQLSPPEMLSRVLPDRPEILLDSASYLYPARDADSERETLSPADQRLFLEKALSLLDAGEPRLSGRELQLKAAVHTRLEQPAEAVAACRRALAESPDDINRRLQLATLLQHQGDFHEARRELLVILARKPDHRQASHLLDAVGRRVVENDLRQRRSPPASRMSPE